MFLNSIRWRLQLWLALLLLCTLSAFGLAMFELRRMQEFEPIEDELQQQVTELKKARLGGSPRWGEDWRFSRPRRHGWWGRKDAALGRTNAAPAMKDDSQQQGETPTGSGQDPSRVEERRRPALRWENSFAKQHTNFAGSSAWQPRSLPFPPATSRFMRNSEARGFYWAIWSRDGTCLGSSSNAPPKLLFPGLAAADPNQKARLRGDYYEVATLDPFGGVVLVGRSVASELEQMDSLVLWLVALGGGVLALGLGGGWWLLGGALRPVTEISATASRISAGKLSERINAGDSSSELDRLAKVLNSMFERLETAFAQQKQFTADSSHELRTPLAIIITEAQTALARPRTAAEYRQTVETCLGTAQQMRRLSESLLELARFDARQAPLKCLPLDLAEQTQQCVELVRPLAAERGIQIRCDLHPSPMMGDPDYIARAIMNLLSNAIRYNRVNGEVQVSTRADNASILLTVADTGIGIEPEELPRIFDRFYRADQARSRGDGCSGLGLAICKAIVDAQAGRIEVASRPGIGTTFTVTWPAPQHP